MAAAETSPVGPTTVVHASITPISFYLHRALPFVLFFPQFFLFHFISAPFSYSFPRFFVDAAPTALLTLPKAVLPGDEYALHTLSRPRSPSSHFLSFIFFHFDFYFAPFALFRGKVRSYGSPFAPGSLPFPCLAKVIRSASYNIILEPEVSSSQTWTRGSSRRLFARTKINFALVCLRKNGKRLQTTNICRELYLKFNR